MPNGNKKTEVEKFFDDLPSDDHSVVDIFEKEGQQQTPAEGGEGEGAAGPAKGEEPRKNRRHRRLEQQLQEEREKRLIAEAKAEGRAEVTRNLPASSELPEKWIRMYGDSPESRQAWALQKEMLDDVAKSTRESTIQEIEDRRKREAEEAAANERFITGELENIEDTFNVDLTSDSPAARKMRREFLQKIEKLSPKDENGSITGFADFEAAWEDYASSRKEEKPDNSRNKELAGRSMTRSGDAAPAARQQTPGFFGWKNDYNLPQ